MFKFIAGRSRGQFLRLLMLLCGMAAAVASQAAELTLEDAEVLALREDPLLRSVESKSESLRELAVAGEQWPDPMLRMGLMSLPTDSWRLGREPMTQVQVGLSQKFPRGQSHALKAEQLLEKSQVLDETFNDQRLRIVMAVREDYLEVLKQIGRAEINAAAIAAFSELSDITQDYYSTGRVQQQDVLRAAVELAKAEDRAARIAQEEERARARLASWIGAAAMGEFEQGWPRLESPAGLDEIARRLAEHPRIAAMQQQVTAAETGVELARQRYKPEFGVDLVYGGRGGENPDGTSRSDLFSVMVMMDLPLFHKNRQDRVVAASVAESSAALFDRDDTYRRMRSEVQFHSATLQRQQQRLRLFETSLLPDAGFNAEAAFEAYQSALDSLTTLMRARITEFELQLEHVELQAELMKTRVRLLYLEGEPG